TDGPRRGGERPPSIGRAGAVRIAHGFSDPYALIGRQVRKINSHRSLPGLERSPVVVEILIVRADGDGVRLDVLNAGIPEKARKSVWNRDRVRKQAVARDAG